MSGVKRYDISGFGGGMIECEDGAWVGADDYEALEAERDELRAQVEAMRAALACPHREGSGRIPVTGRGAAFGVTNHCPYCEPRQ